MLSLIFREFLFFQYLSILESAHLVAFRILTVAYFMAYIVCFRVCVVWRILTRLACRNVKAAEKLPWCWCEWFGSVHGSLCLSVGISWLHAKGTKHLRKSPSSLQAGQVEASPVWLEMLPTAMACARLIDWPAHWLSMLGEKPAGGSVPSDSSMFTYCIRSSKCIYLLHFGIWCKRCLWFEKCFTQTISFWFEQTHNKKYLTLMQLSRLFLMNRSKD